MNHGFRIGQLATVAAASFMGVHANADIVTESGDFGAFPSSAGVPTGAGSIDRVVGSLYTGNVLGDFADAIQFKATSSSVSFVFDNATNTPFANWVYLYDAATSMPVARGSRVGLLSRLDWVVALGNDYVFIVSDSPMRPLGTNGLQQFTYGNTGSSIAANGGGAGFAINGYDGNQNPIQKNWAFNVSGAGYVVPAPASLALLATGLAVVNRRRRCC